MSDDGREVVCIIAVIFFWCMAVVLTPVFVIFSLCFVLYVCWYRPKHSPDDKVDKKDE